MMRAMFISILMMFTITLWGNTQATKAAYPLSKETVRIEGFSQFPNTTFYHIYAKSVRKIIINQVVGDAINITPGGNGSMQYISWDTSLSTLKHGIELSGEDNVTLIQYISLYRNDKKPRAIEIPSYGSCRKINHISSFYRLNRYAHYTDALANNGIKEFSLNLNKRVYSGGTDNITITSNFHDMQVIIDKLTHQPEKAPGFILTTEEANAIRAYADSLKRRDVSTLYVIRKKPAANPADSQSNNLEKPHGVLRLKLSGFENITLGRFHLLIVGVSGIVCKRIHGNNLNVMLNEDEKGYISRSKYWDWKKKNVLFDRDSEEYKHFKFNLHPTNRNDEPIVEIPINQINGDNESETYQFEVVKQLPELAQTKEDFLIKFKESDRKAIPKLSIDFKNLSEGYDNTEWMTFIINFLAVLLMALIIKYLVLLFLYKLVCGESGWYIKFQLFYTCLGGAFITLSAVWFLLPLIHIFVPAKLIVAIVFTILTESIIYQKILYIPFKKALFLVFCCNLACFSVLLLLFS